MTTQPPDRLFRPVSPAAQAKGERVFCAAVALLLPHDPLAPAHYVEGLALLGAVIGLALSLRRQAAMPAAAQA